ncbi:uncharacterized protein MELLADRAFT_108039 [Melampsora larici-populina 98AG31]|uniref:PWI domain-containing protein n=1 Tax=Melampsora larici-populina (strain 98AG31 / pathotype 3-4-7) TaxID=747676 RepID=F4RRS0_MELLP|nr:uncharacterized protein MELLADRAFT_108039 [Melampsora larici-populina 98AG31]EGG04908.1 hypothetical protein MELLADRAFT_108039 [Melampsora larici-populina 98AG31]
MYGGAYPPYPPHGQQPPLGYGPPPPGAFQPPLGSPPFVQPGMNHTTTPQPPNPMGFAQPPPGSTPSQQSPAPMGYGAPHSQQPSPSPQPASQPHQHSPQGPLPVGNSFHHLPPPPGFPHLHPQHLPPPGLHQPPKPFGFAEYGDPESVLRCMKVIDGAKLPINGGRGGEKALMIKPDDKTKARLDTYAATKIKTDQDTELDTQVIERLEGLISQMKDPDILAATASESTSANNPAATANGSNKKNMAAHLQDLAPEDLPEESRGLITREIQFFRERAISKRGDAEKSKEQRDRASRDGGSGSPAGSRGFGGSNNNNKAGYGSSNNTPMGPRGGSGSGPSGSPANDPQTFNRPMGFVRAGQMAAAQQQLGSGSSNHDASLPVNDEEEEKMREDRKKRMNHLEFKDRERRWETRERNRAQTNQRDQQREKSIRDEETRIRNQTKARLSNWDDDIEISRGKELFYSNRSKWRSIRKTFRQREEKSDRIDEELEQEQLEAIKKESEDFLNRQAEMIAKIQDENRKAGLLQLDEGGKPIQLSFGGFSASHNSNQTNGKNNSGGTSTTLQPISLKKENKSNGGVLGGNEDDDDGFRKKRALIPLTYDDDETKQNPTPSKINIQFGNPTITSKPRETAGMVEEKKKKKMREIVSSIPNDKDALWLLTVDWKWLSETIIKEKLEPFANKKIIEYLGMQEDELVSAIIDHIRAHKDAQGLVTELEPVLAEEAEEFTLKFWRVLIFELRAAEAGLISNNTTT